MSQSHGNALLEGVEAWAQKRRDSESRLAAVSRLREQGVPTRRHEDWRFTDLGPWSEPRVCVGEPSGTLESTAFAVPGLDAIDVDLPNGRLTGIPEIDGVRIRPWTDEEISSAQSAALAPALESLNRAWCDRGVVIEVEEGVRVSRPLHLKVGSSAGAGYFPQTRVLLRLGRSCELRLLEHHRSAVDSSALNLHVDVELGENAKLEHVQMTRVEARSAHATNLHSRLARDARYRHWNFVLGGGWVRNDLHCRLEGVHAEASLMGLTVAGSGQMIDAHTRVEHATDHGRSRENYRHVLDSDARVVFAGRVFVAPDVRDSDAEQNNANLLLSPQARMNALPQLEIYNDEVKASHGSSMGQLDEDALFYLRSRGIDRQTAKGLLLWGFANTIVQELDWPEVAALVRAEVRGQLTILPEGGDS